MSNSYQRRTTRAHKQRESSAALTNMKENMTEDQLQKQVAQYLRAQYPNLLWFHCPNGGSRNVIEAAKLKGMGVLPGVADILLFDWDCDPSEPYDYPMLMAIELKVAKRKQTDSQIEFQKKWEACGGKYAVCRSLDEVISVLQSWLD